MLTEATHSTWVCIECGSEELIDHTYCTRCGSPSDPLKDRILAGKYKLIRKLAGGGMGVVYLAEHMHLKYKKQRAIKLLHAHLLHDHTLRVRFLREIQLTHLVSQNNPHIVQVHDDYGFEKGIGFYVMEYLEGDTLERRIAQYPHGLPLHTIRHIGLQVCSAMQSIHQADIVHRDLKPANIFLVQNEQYKDFVKVMDFGIAKAEHAGTQHTQEGSIIGTAQYLSPEQIRASSEPNRLDARSDLYAFGCILFEMLTGSPPFPLSASTLEIEQNLSPISLQTLAFKHLTEEPPALLEKRPDAPIELAHFIQFSMLAKQREDRPQSIQEIEEMLCLLPELEGGEHRTSTSGDSFVQQRPRGTAPSHPLQTSPHLLSDSFPPNPHSKHPSFERSTAIHAAPSPRYEGMEKLNTSEEQEPVLHSSSFSKRTVFLGICMGLCIALVGVFFVRYYRSLPSSTHTQHSSTQKKHSSTSQPVTSFGDSLASSRRPIPTRKIERTPPSKRTKEPGRSLPRKRKKPKRRKIPTSRWVRIQIRASSGYLRQNRLYIRPKGAYTLKGMRLFIKKGHKVRIRVRSRQKRFGFYPCMFSVSSRKRMVRLTSLISKDQLAPDSLDYCRAQ